MIKNGLNVEVQQNGENTNNDNKILFTSDEYLPKEEGDDQDYAADLNHDPHVQESLELAYNLQEDQVRRSRKNIPRQSYAEFNENGLTVGENQDEGEYQLIKCKQFDKKSNQDQPIEVYISFQAYLFMHVHAHLFHNEIIGFGGGYTFKHKNGKQAIYVHDSYSVKPLEDTGTDRTKSVEMDPDSQSLVTNMIESKGQAI